MAVGDTITALRYNNLQSNIETILGNGSSTSGYGQTVTSTQVAVTATVQASDMQTLYNDMVNARGHQTGSTPTAIASIAVGNVIGENTSDNPDGTAKGYTDFEALMTNIIADKLVVAGSETTPAVARTSAMSNWNGTHSHIVTFTWPSSDARRHFFNTGGELRTSASLTSATNSKATNWSSMFTAMGTIKMNYTQTVSSLGSGTGSNIGFYDLTASYQQIYRKTGSGVYSENDYIVQACAATATTVDIRIYFQDDDPADEIAGSPPFPPVDENVTGTTTSTVSYLRASGSYVSIPAPTSANTSTL